MEGFNGRDIGDVLEIAASHFVDKRRERKCPLVRTNSDEE